VCFLNSSTEDVPARISINPGSSRFRRLHSHIRINEHQFPSPTTLNPFFGVAVSYGVGVFTKYLSRVATSSKTIHLSFVLAVSFSYRNDESLHPSHAGRTATTLFHRRSKPGRRVELPSCSSHLRGALSSNIQWCYNWLLHRRFSCNDDLLE